MLCDCRDGAVIGSPTRRSSWRTLWSGVALAWCAFAAGCSGPTGPDRFPLTGNVVREGQPVDAGTIQLIPTGTGPAASTQIKDGKYQFTKENGPVAGTHTVVILQALPRAEVPPGTPKKDAEILPETRFKKPMPKSGWKLETTIDKGQNFADLVDFDLDTAVADTRAGGGRKEKP